MWMATAAAAPQTIAPRSESINSEFGCELDFEYYQPHQQPPLNTVILAHGFMRNLTTMRGWAQHWQSLGIATVVVSFCNANLINGHHQRNAADMIALRTHLQLGKVTYSGFSAGGLAAYLAALQDDQAMGYLGLDAVDSGKLARNESNRLTVAALFLVAGPSSCNAKNNMSWTIEQHDYPVSHVEGATHCHFESPYDKRCGWLCGRTSEQDTAVIQADIMEQATRFIVELGTRESIPLPSS